MKPHRLALTHSLVLAYGLYRKMEVYLPHVAQSDELSAFHASDYVDFLQRVTPDNANDYSKQLQRFQLGELTDCPVFDEMYRFCALCVFRVGRSPPSGQKLLYNTQATLCCPNRSKL